MMLKKRSSLIIVVLLALLSIGLLACGDKGSSTTPDNGNNQENKNENTDKGNNEGNVNGNDEIEVPEIDMSQPITLKMNDWRGEETFFHEFKEPIEDKFPNVTIEHIPIMPYKSTLEEHFAEGIVLDILLAPDFRYLPVYNEVELAYDITEFVEMYQLDIGRYDQNFLDIMRSYSKDGELWGLPYMHNKAALHYNKGIFDLFGVEYPTDDMTYDEVYELAKKVTGERDGTYYTGMVMPSADRYLFPPLGLTILDPETDEPLYTKDPAFQKIFETYKQVHELQEEPTAPHGDGAYTKFISEQTLAMLPMYFLGLGWTGLLDAQDAGLDWDVVTFPKWDNQGDVAAFADGYWLGISAYSEYKPQVYKIIEFLVSEEQVLHKIRYPEESVYTDEQFFAISGDLQDPRLDDKNMEALYKYQAPHAPDGRSIYEEIAKATLGEMMGDFLNSAKDVNTFLRELSEETTRRILEEKGAD